MGENRTGERIETYSGRICGDADESHANSDGGQVMAVMGTLVTTLAVDATKFNKGLSTASGGIKSFASSAASFLNPITAAFATVAASAAAAGLSIYGIANRIADLAAINDKAMQTGLSGKFLQQLGYAADQSGVSVDLLRTSVSKMTQAIGKATMGDKAAQKGLADIGIRIEDIVSLHPDQQFKVIAERISKLPTVATRAAAAMKIFGKSAIDLGPLLSDGAKGIDTLLKEAERLGIGLNAASFEKIARADDAIQRMKSSFSALVDQIAVGLAPAFEFVADKVTALIGPVTKLFSKFNAMPNQWKFLSDIMTASFTLAIETIKFRFKEMLAEILRSTIQAALQMAQLLTPAGLAKFAIDNAGAVAKAAGAGAGGKPSQSGVDKAAKALQELVDKFNKINPAEDKVGPAMPGHFIRPGDEAAYDMAPAVRESKAQLPAGMIRGSVEAYSTIVQSRNDQVKAINTLIGVNKKGFEALIERQENAAAVEIVEEF